MERPRITCTTCQARLRVKNLASLGQIVACPRCGSMVMVPTASIAQPSADTPVDVAGPMAGEHAIADSRTEEDAQPDRVALPDEQGDGDTTVAELLHEPHDAMPAPVDPAWGLPSGGPNWSRLGLLTTVSAALLAGTVLAWRILSGGPGEANTPSDVASTRAVASTLSDRSENLDVADHADASPEPFNSSQVTADATEPGLPVSVEPEPTGSVTPTDPSIAPDNLSHSADPDTEQAVHPTSGASTVVPDTVANAGQSDIEPAKLGALTPTDVVPNTDNVTTTSRAATTTSRAATTASGAATTTDTATADTSALARYGDLLSNAGPVEGLTAQAPTDGPDRGDAEAGEVPQPANRSVEERLLRDMTARRLQLEVQKLDGTDQNLLQVMHTLGRMAGAHVHIDPAAVLLHDVSLVKPQGLVYVDQTLEQILTDLLRVQQLGFRVEPGYLHVHALGGDKRGIQRVEYRVGDMALGDDAVVGWFAEQIPRFIAPGSWNQRGGSAQLSVKGEELTIDQTPEVHWEIMRFLETLRTARGIPLRSRYEPERFQLGCRARRAAQWLQRPVEMVVRQPSQLEDLLARLAQSMQIGIVVDWHELIHHAGMTTPVAIYAKGEPLADVLQALLPEELDYRVIDEGLLQVTSAQAARQTGEWEMYAIPEALRSVPDETLQQELTRVGQQSLAVGADGVLVVIDPRAPVIVVLAPVHVQLAVDQWLRQTAVDREQKVATP